MRIIKPIPEAPDSNEDSIDENDDDDTLADLPGLQNRNRNDSCRECSGPPKVKAAT